MMEEQGETAGQVGEGLALEAYRVVSYLFISPSSSIKIRASPQR